MQSTPEHVLCTVENGVTDLTVDPGNPSEGSPAPRSYVRKTVKTESGKKINKIYGKVNARMTIHVH